MFVAFRRHDDQFRKLLVESVPGIEPVLKVLLQEDGNALESATKTISQAGKTVSDFGTTVSGIGGKVSDVTSSVTGFFGGSPAVPEKASPSKARELHILSGFVTSLTLIRTVGDRIELA